MGLSHPFAQAYTYDSLNRLASATETNNSTQTWTQVFGYDRYGNRNITSGTGQTSLTFGSTNNRITTSGYSYDLAGNTSADPSGKSFVYDAENKQTSVSDGGGTLGTYYYDGDGKRVKKISASDSVIFVYDAAGKLIEERNSSTGELQTSYVYAGSRLLTTEASSGTNYLTNDHLGSPRINTDASGAVTARHDYHPFGEEIATTQRTAGIGYTADTVRKQFTGYERDGETNLDFAQARYYARDQGRFSTADPLLSSGETEYPQTWNRYVFTVNNPLFFVDESGLYVCSSKKKEECQAFAAALAEAKANLAKIETTYGKKSDEYKKAEKAIAAYGEDETGKKTNNGVYVKFTYKEAGGKTTATFDPNGKIQGNIVVNFNIDSLKKDNAQALVAHEGSHVSDNKGGLRKQFDLEFDGHVVHSLFSEAKFPNSGRGFSAKDGTKYPIWEPGWVGPDKATLRSNAVVKWLAVPSKNGGYGLTKPRITPTRPGRKKN